ncbi:Transcriptional regulator, AcrR family [hydrothermal vent metagenome]|uniref:Transcriptional regulator, AcrR family n=1 Tax=hydrothermal vent metagenome TaxID=652676 RepID=A0A3B1A5G8_9ZZZZ
MDANDSKIIEDLRELILDAAVARFQRYGYGKTTMAEIAKDSDMSAANLYRYFKNKQDIAAVCAGRCMNEQQNLMCEFVRQSHSNAAETLRIFVVEGLKSTHQMYLEQPKINELVEFIASERQDIVHKKIQAQHNLITEILAQGNKSGEFNITDLVVTARAVQNALVKFNVPIFMALYPLDEFIVMANEVVDLILQGLQKQ